MAIIGIDLGTTNSLGAVWRNGKSELIPNVFGEYLTPSVVSVSEEGEIYVGKVARERLIIDPENTASIFKRFMGTNKKYNLSGNTYAPEELSSFVLRKIKEDAENYLGETVTEAIVSVPAYFSNAQRDATKRAGELAGLNVQRIINEPSAAALACQQEYPEEEALEMVFDFGGGTLDVSIVDCFENVIDVIAVSGDNHLGGHDFDLAVARFFCRRCALAYDSLSPTDQAIVRKSAEQCKIRLSAEEKVEMQVTLSDKNYSLLFDAELLVQASAEVFERMVVPIKQALTGAAVKWNEINRMILVGGSCNMPVVRLYLQHFLKKEVAFLGSPDTIVALGTGVYAGIKERNAQVKDMLLTDVCPFTLGVDIVHNVMSPVIERNSALPISKSRIYQTIRSGQTVVEFNVYQGESPVASDNIKLGRLSVKVPDNEAGAEKILIRFTYDINGILEVNGTTISTGEEKQLVIVDPQNHMSREQIQKRLDALQQLKIHPRQQEENVWLMDRCKALYMQSSLDVREKLTQELQYFEYLLDKQDPMMIKRGRRRLEKVLDSLEEYMKQFSVDISEGTANWYQEALEEENLDSDFADWFGKEHLTS
ncbi:MAG: molecular chaperone HscC [Hespellia sp.]|nr:molecular chaperone HscC [Hespellia sp.]